MESLPVKSEIVRPAVIESLPELLQWVHDQIRSSGLPIKMARKFELALEEAIVNVIEYAYPQEAGAITLKTVFHPLQKLEFIIEDHGIPFNPLNEIKVNQSSEEEIAIGGLGITFLKTFVDQAHYERIDNANVLKVVKNLNVSSQLPR
ncbi:MAG: ATP-binding protein [Verrucomicrobia bacterium]|nr:ATP-binding protein [Verrucomicrobiota bacterium]